MESSQQPTVLHQSLLIYWQSSDNFQELQGLPCLLIIFAPSLVWQGKTVPQMSHTVGTAYSVRLRNLRSFGEKTCCHIQVERRAGESLMLLGLLVQESTDTAIVQNTVTFHWLQNFTFWTSTFHDRPFRYHWFDLLWRFQWIGMRPWGY
jgi:hypothetical protein